MSETFLYLAAAMFLIPLVVMVGIALTGTNIPTSILSVGGWSMAFGLIVGGIGAFMSLSER